MGEEEILQQASSDRYLKSGAHIGTKYKSGDMGRFIYKVRKDGLKVLSISVLDERIKIAANFLSKYPPEKIVVISRKLYGQAPAQAFASAIGARVIKNRFVPGTFTNPAAKEFIEPKVVLITEPESDSQAIQEATRIRVPVVALCSINNVTKDIDLVIPVNNKGRQSLALVYWELAKQFLLKNGAIKSESEFAKTIDEFEYKLKEGDIAEDEDSGRRRFGRGGFKGRGAGGRGNFQKRPFSDNRARYGRYADAITEPTGPVPDDKKNAKPAEKSGHTPAAKPAEHKPAEKPAEHKRESKPAEAKKDHAEKPKKRDLSSSSNAPILAAAKIREHAEKAKKEA
jgi:small subunit ribosomal protein S2